MVKTKVIHQFWLFLFGVILCFVFLEVGMRAASFLFFKQQETANQTQSFSGKEFRILCIGESTTALGGEYAYPRQLEKILNARQQNIRFKVINKGVPATTTDQILSRVEGYLKQYQPDLVVAMMGINDPMMVKKKSWLEKAGTYSKVFKLINALQEHLAAKIASGQTPSLDQQIQILEKKLQERRFTPLALELTKANLYRSANRPDDELRSIEKALSLDSQNPQAWYFLGIHYERQAEYAKALEAFEKSNTRITPEFQIQILSHMAQCYKFLDQPEKAQKIYEALLTQVPHHPEAYDALGDLYQELKKYPQAISSYEKQLSINPSKIETYSKLAHCYRLSSQPDKAEAVLEAGIQAHPRAIALYYELSLLLSDRRAFDRSLDMLSKAQRVLGDNDQEWRKKISRLVKSNQQFLGQPSGEEGVSQNLPTDPQPENAMTQRNYKKLIQMLRRYHIPLLAVQYPHRPLATLKAMTREDAGIRYVDNFENFDQALKSSSYDRLFTDHFAGDFGHCTPRGNALLAENIAEQILRFIK